jgi:N-carbamoylputrescine amidase
MKRIKVGVCESPPEMEPGSATWEGFSEKVRGFGLDIFLLNELPFGPWISSGETLDLDTWRRSCDLHDYGMRVLGELGAGVVLGSRARESEGRRVNEAFVWTSEGDCAGVHTKQYFPDEEGYYESRWFQAGERHFHVANAGLAKVGFLLCTEVMFNEHARHYGRNGAQVIAVPRAVGRESLHRWLVAMKMAAVVSGCYVITSNRNGVDSNGQEYGGCGWIVDPSGDLVAQTSWASSIATYELNLDFVTTAQSEYPCYVKEQNT